MSIRRAALGPAPLAGLHARLLPAVGAEYRAFGYRAVFAGEPGHELVLGSIDGSVTRVPDTPANREAFGSALFWRTVTCRQALWWVCAAVRGGW
jgi:hypothetical protein